MTWWDISHYLSVMGSLIDDIEKFLRRHQMRPGTFGKKTVNDGKFVLRLKGGGRCWPETEKLVRDFMKDHTGAAQ